jgi:hypothetical protein
VFGQLFEGESLLIQRDVYCQELGRQNKELMQDFD